MAFQTQATIIFFATYLNNVCRFDMPNYVAVGTHSKISNVEHLVLFTWILYSTQYWVHKILWLETPWVRWSPNHLLITMFNQKKIDYCILALERTKDFTVILFGTFLQKYTYRISMTNVVTFSKVWDHISIVSFVNLPVMF